MLTPADRMSATDYLKLVGTNEPAIAADAPLIERLFAEGAPFGKLTRQGVQLGPEDRVSADYFLLMKAAIQERRYVGFCTHIGNESGERGNELRTKRRQHKKKVLGMVPGATDWIHIWTTLGTLGAGVIELKRPGRKEGGLSNNQAMVRDWCKACGIPWACHNKAEAAFEQLIEWGGVRDA